MMRSESAARLRARDMAWRTRTSRIGFFPAPPPTPGEGSRNWSSSM